MTTLALSVSEQAELVCREARLERNIRAFLEAGQDLLYIRDNRLYRSNYATFEEYCDQRWYLKQSRAYQLMDAATVVGNLQSSTIVELPANEAQVRPLTSLTPDAQRAAWTEAVQTAPNGKLTAAHVEQVVEQYKPAKVSSFDPDQEREGEAPETMDDPTPEFQDAPEPVDLRPAKAMDVHYQSESKEWYTPADFLKAVRDVLGEIDLDPASSESANQIVGANRFFDRQANGLAQAWTADTVYCNPPYGDEIRAFVEKAIAELERGSYSAGILLVPARTDTAWFGLLREYPRCFLTGRLKFWNSADASVTSAPFPSVAFFLGQDATRFVEVFSRLGDVYALWSL